MNRFLALLVVGVTLLGCRTSIAPVTKGDEKSDYVPEGGSPAR